MLQPIIDTQTYKTVHAMKSIQEIYTHILLPREPLSVKQTVGHGVFISQRNKTSIDVGLEICPELIRKRLILAIVRSMPFIRDWRVEGKTCCKVVS